MWAGVWPQKYTIRPQTVNIYIKMLCETQTSIRSKFILYVDLVFLQKEFRIPCTKQIELCLQLQLLVLVIFLLLF